MKKTASYLLLVIFLSGCASHAQRQELASQLAHAGQLQAVEYSSSTFDLAGFQRIGRSGQAIRIYIEGDGRAWLRPGRRSTDPTPGNPVALRLAALDPAANVIYLARPCQYIGLQSPSRCHSDYWTHKRFSAEVIRAYDEVLDQLQLRMQGVNFHLVGFSGGAAVAVLLAARRTDIASLSTIAGNLDPTALNHDRGFSPLMGSLDPLNSAKINRQIPQRHFSGLRDKVIPAWVAKNYAAFSPECASTLEADASHREGWEAVWLKHVRQSPQCD
jgi:pimeloyl-ACP methyl ester carboxylesterase